MTRYLLTAVLTLCAVGGFANPSKVVRHLATGIPGEYIVVLKDTTPSNAVSGIARSLAAAYNVEVETVWEYSLRGFLCKGSDQSIEAMAGDPRIKFVEQNFTTDGPQPDVSGTQWTWLNGQYMWHLDRIDETSWANRDSFHNMCTEGRSVYAYVIDRGVQT